MAVTGHGPASSTVTRSTRPSSVNRWVIPSFLARIAGIGLPEGESDLDVDARGEMVEPLERVDRLRRGLMDVDQALVRPDLEVLLGVLVLERGLHHGVHVLLRGQGHRTRHGRAGACRGLHDLLRSRLDGRRVVGLEADADLVLGYSCHWVRFFCPVLEVKFVWVLARCGARSARTEGGPRGVDPARPRPQWSYLPTSRRHAACLARAGGTACYLM